MLRRFVTAIMITTLLLSQGVSALSVACDMENMPEMSESSMSSESLMVQQHASHGQMNHHEMSSDSKSNMQSSQDCCNKTCDCEHGTAFSAALFAANLFPDSVIHHQKVIAEQFRALDAHTSNLIKPPII
ncbi:hypothetical protein [Aliiglaciecola lipolytica]|uniref:hypothetical protein n=1 Tax=Aliiglaciecola lipolytica TaxID=477689 RepID=UPI001C095816|nr:hypothetical protein [Aliiglaciecola lipolytica]MBU2880291.1 hypothetical protein [Aliiglaciecola lipolytica]